MASYLPIVTFVLGLLVAGVFAYLMGIARERDFKHTIAAYARLIETDDTRFSSVMDRLHATKNLPPEAVNMKSEHEERREQSRIKKQEMDDLGLGQIPKRHGPVDSGVLEMELQVLRDRKKTAS